MTTQTQITFEKLDSGTSPSASLGSGTTGDQGAAPAAHTPGPWEVDGNIAVRSSGPAGRQVALAEISVRGRPWDETYNEAMANARLIAAAPDLLAALIQTAQELEFQLEASKGGNVRGVTEDHRYEMASRLRTLRTAIALATGAQS